jgi:hypothetical protein
MFQQMKTAIPRLLSLLTLIAIIVGIVVAPRQSRAAARSPAEVPDTYPPYLAEYYPQTGHSAVNSFELFWRNTPNALFVLGYPISRPFIEESFTNPGEYYRVQYFERAILEEHPENYGTPYYILGRLLGTQLAKGRENEPPFQPVPDPRDGTWDSVTRHTLRNSPAPFRTFWLNNGGLAVFGRPISEQFQEVNKADGKTYWVQYFERQRMEWHPDEPDPRYRILLGLLGNEYRDANHRTNPAFTPAPAMMHARCRARSSTATMRISTRIANPGRIASACCNWSRTAASAGCVSRCAGWICTTVRVRSTGKNSTTSCATPMKWA